MFWTFRSSEQSTVFYANCLVGLTQQWPRTRMPGYVDSKFLTLRDRLPKNREQAWQVIQRERVDTARQASAELAEAIFISRFGHTHCQVVVSTRSKVAKLFSLLRHQLARYE